MAVVPKLMGHIPSAWESLVPNPLNPVDGGRFSPAVSASGVCREPYRHLCRAPQALEKLMVIRNHFLFSIMKPKMVSDNYFLTFLRLGEPCRGICGTPHIPEGWPPALCSHTIMDSVPTFSPTLQRLSLSRSLGTTAPRRLPAARNPSRDTAVAVWMLLYHHIGILIGLSSVCSQYTVVNNSLVFLLPFLCWLRCMLAESVWLQSMYVPHRKHYELCK